MNRGMPKSSVEELRGQIAAGQYAVDAGVLAGDILSKVALIRGVKRLLMGEDQEGAETEPERASQAQRWRGSTSRTRRSTQPHNDRLP